MWTLSVTDTFLNELLNLPQSISKKVTKSVKVLEQDPISAGGDAKKLKGYHNNTYRIRVGDYRVFYSFGQGWVKLLSVRKRDERTYETEIPQFQTPTKPPQEDVRIQQNKEQEAVVEKYPVFPSYSPNDTTSCQITTALPVELTTSLLQQWQIPQQYWADILKVDNSEAILELSIPDKLISRILDNLFPRPIEEIEKQPQYILQGTEDLDRFFTGDLSAFLLKLDPEQEKLRDFGGSGPILVKGGPGTGKSTLALYRVQKLLQQGYRSILFTTYTNALVTYSQQLLEQLLGERLQNLDVEVSTVDSLIYNYYIKSYDKPVFATQQQCLGCLQSALSTTEIPASNVFDQRVRRQTLENLGLPYLLQEIQSVIQAWGISSLEEYQNLDRHGRGVALKANIREAIWAVYQTWRSLMVSQRYTTTEQMRLQALGVVNQLAQKPYQAIVIDEAQDLSPISLRFLLALVPDLSGVYLTADASQSLYQRGFSWKQIHSDLKVAGRTLILKRNYRNTQQIITACTNILEGTEAGDSECLYQEPSSHQGDFPSLLLIDDTEQEIKAIREFFITAAKNFRFPLHGSAVLCPSNQAGRFYAEKLTKLGLKAKFVSGKEINLKAPYIKVLTLHSAKGLEFPAVVVIGLKTGQLPHINLLIPVEESNIIINEQKRLFYVACSRAMRALMVCGSAISPSPFVKSLNSANWRIIQN
ncbi:3'-5' exonuclease [Nostoc sp. FACHB-145]|uniref:3'-5' exonuclease n=1 Tax=Nostoc sp. FACHB-145 TaxID=2692836 RepID=UPI001681E530|nr:3'-5' exonuclease [Nostoc sp. FACHB-145]MBD2471549.1 AAA family ATPase [Nostoc sp. FACHB-145]